MLSFSVYSRGLYIPLDGILECLELHKIHTQTLTHTVLNFRMRVCLCVEVGERELLERWDNEHTLNIISIWFFFLFGLCLISLK